MGSNKNTLKKTTSKASYMAGQVDGLPEGWRVEIRTRESGNYAGSTYKCYIDPVTGHKCYSMGEVSRYLKSGSEQEGSTVPEAHIQESSVTKTHVGTERKDALDGLPAGWTVDIKVRRSGTKQKYDPYYTDPGTGYVFRSKRDVLRYLKTGKPGKYARHPNNMKQQDVTSSKVNDKLVKGHQSTGQRCSNSDELVNNEPVFVGQCSISDEAVNDEPKLDAQLSKADEAVNGERVVESSAIGGGDMEVSTSFPLKKKISKKRKGKKATYAKRILSTQATYIPPIEGQSVENSGEEHKGRQTQIGSKKRKKYVELDTPRRASKRLAAIVAQTVTVMEGPSGTPQMDAVGQPPEDELAFNSLGADAKLASAMEGPKATPHVEAAEQPPEAKLAVNSTGSNDELASDMEGPDTTRAALVELPSRANLAVSLTSVDSARLVSAQFNQSEPEKSGICAADPLTGEIHLKQEGSQVTTEEVTTTICASGGEAYFEQPLLDHVSPGEPDIETLADGILGDPLASPFGELWTDPCLEFAYKTLTGAIPVDDGEPITISNTIPVSDPFLEFAYNTPTRTIPVGDNPSTACLDAIPLSDPCIEFAYKTLTGENIPPVTFSDAIPTSDPCIEFAYRTLTGETLMETPTREENKQAVPVPNPSVVPLSDPCLEFAYKTLIGAIPLEDTLAYRDFLQQQTYGQTQNYNLADGFFGSVANPTSLNKFQNDSVRASPDESLQRFSNNVVQHPNGNGEMDNKRR